MENDCIHVGIAYNETTQKLTSAAHTNFIALFIWPKKQLSGLCAIKRAMVWINFYNDL